MKPSVKPRYDAIFHPSSFFLSVTRRLIILESKSLQYFHKVNTAAGLTGGKKKSAALWMSSRSKRLDRSKSWADV